MATALAVVFAATTVTLNGQTGALALPPATATLSLAASVTVPGRCDDATVTVDRRANAALPRGAEALLATSLVRRAAHFAARLGVRGAGAPGGELREQRLVYDGIVWLDAEDLVLHVDRLERAAGGGTYV